MKDQKIGKVQMGRNLKIQIISFDCGVFATFYLFQINDFLTTKVKQSLLLTQSWMNTLFTFCLSEESFFKSHHSLFFCFVLFYLFPMDSKTLFQPNKTISSVTLCVE